MDFEDRAFLIDEAFANLSHLLTEHLPIPFVLKAEDAAEHTKEMDSLRRAMREMPIDNLTARMIALYTLHLQVALSMAGVADSFERDGKAAEAEWRDRVLIYETATMNAMFEDIHHRIQNA